ncbi:cobalt transporter [Arthrobacter sp. Soil782]|uniref:cation diffusion facilitator family transporter n=1 Tax=Arthrobacter sp. Soil782 TaxID=1736410 RepID=UPI0006FC84B2|nr:cation diffusion facilitator family transporter [Arthrobacter sp. Soil782]KRF08963.1 cobalt transporter [Arthrobacter sp. Soil782]
MSKILGEVDNEILPKEVEDHLHKAVRLEWITIAAVLGIVVIVFLSMGNSQAMKTAWIEDMLSFVPPIAFLIGVRMTRRPATAGHPYGYHRAIGVSHMVAASALCVMGGFLIFDCLKALIAAEHPTIGAMNLFGTPVWSGWIMIAAMVITAIPPVILGRLKLRLAPPLHNKVLYADADMNKADWMTSVAAIVGIVGIGLGWWWADAAAALVIAFSIMKDGITNLRAALAALMDARPTTVDNATVHPLLGKVNAYLRDVEWVSAGAARLRDEGQVFHVEGFVVPKQDEKATAERLDAIREGLLTMDWKIRDVVVTAVNEVPSVLGEK